MFGVVLFGLIINAVLAQRASSFSVSIKVDNPALQRGQAAVVHTTIKWGSVPHAKGETLEAIYLRLKKPGVDPMLCSRGDCIGATFALPKPITPEAGQLMEFEVALSDLYWNDLISSQLDLSRPKNLFDVVTTGRYSLYAAVRFPADDSTKHDPRVIEVASNSVTVDVK